MAPIAIKVLIVGAAQSGKTAYVKRLAAGEFGRPPAPTIGVDVATHAKRCADGRLIVFSLWDTAGDPQFQGAGFSLLDTHYANASW